MHVKSRSIITIELEENEARELYSFLFVAHNTSGVPRPDAVKNLMDVLKTEGVGR